MLDNTVARTAWGQCFLCQRLVQLVWKSGPRRGSVGYYCRHCGGVNSQRRIEAGEDIHGYVCIDPVVTIIETKEEAC